MTKNKLKINNYIDKYKKKLGLEDISIDYFVVSDDHWISEADEDESKLVRVDYYAEVIKTAPFNFTIVINKSALKEDIENTIVHELIHILLWPMFSTSELIVETSNEFCGAGKVNMINKLRDTEHEILEKILKLVI